MSPDLAFNTSVSFETNTNWQNYSGETGATYLTQAAMLAVRNFTSAATGLAVAIALIRGLTRRSAKTLGNYWVDLTRGVLYILLPISIVGALVLVWQGVPQTWNPTQVVTTLQGATQNIAIGPIASQEWIKEMGNNGGGFFNANSSHPFENPTAADELARDLRPPGDLVRADLHVRQVRRQPAPGLDDLRRDGRDPARRRRRSRCTSSSTGNPLFPAGVDQAALGNMEGKETRFGAAVGGLFMAATTGTSTGAINSWHDSAQPIAGLVPLFNMELGEITPGRHRRRHVRHARHRRDPRRLHRRADGRPDAGVPRQEGRGLRDQDGDDHRPRARRQHPRLHRPGDASCRRASQGPLNTGPHGFSEILYAYSSQTGNNGSAFAGLTGNTPFYNVTGGFAMLIGRYGMIVPILALAGSMAAKRRVAPSLGTFPTTGVLWTRPADRRRDHRRRADVLPGAVARADRRAAPPERRKGLLMSLTSSLSRSTSVAAPAASSASSPSAARSQSAASRRARAASSTRTCSGRPCRRRSASSIRAC